MEAHNILTKYRPKTLEDFICDSKTFKKLKNLFDIDNLKYNVFIISGNYGIGKTSLARIFAGMIGLSEDSPDYREENIGTDRGIDFARQLGEIILSKPFYGTFKVLVLDEAHNFTKQAQETLLKPLEEIPENNFVFLLTTNPDGINPGIKSRACSINLDPDKEDLYFLEKLEALLTKIIENEK